MNFPDGSFSLRDYIAYMFPGLVVITAACVWDPAIVRWFEEHKLVGSVTVLGGSYILGTLCQMVSYGLILNILRKPLGNPSRALSPKRHLFFKGFCPAFSQQVRVLLERHWGTQLSSEIPEERLLLLCWRAVQTQPHASFEYMKRCVSLSNYYATMLSADVILLIALLVRRHWLAAVAAMVSFFLFARGYYNYRAQFVRNVYRLFYIRYRNVHRCTGDAENENRGQ